MHCKIFNKNKRGKGTPAQKYSVFALRYNGFNTFA